ncbi:hypothetical protein Glove_99g53 [Diversispora epigaea]|uniref:ABC transporter domain-containing protein n=1 Tax=Diversispora epigaea TaxID=1348612 RepID=A0A397J4H4_9GLOM|nr:hypothetical protein Glove_99g53 [Diversispora epigaea]
MNIYKWMMIICLLGIFLFSNKISCQFITTTIPSLVPSPIPTESESESVPVAETYLDPRVYAELISKKPAIPDDGTEPSDSCVYVSAPRPYENKSVSWDCEAGYYCLSPRKSSKFPCTEGFYCPENTQPVYCCEGYYCENPKTIKLCPDGYFCPIGTVNPPSCHYMAYCPPGSTSANKYFIGFLVAVLILSILIAFQVKKKADDEKNKTKKISSVEPRFENSEKTLNRVSKTIDIDFNNLGLVLPSGIEVMREVSGKFKHGRTCAIMGPSGSGKTTLVSLLTGKVRRTDGSVSVRKFNKNGVEVEEKQNLDYYRKLIGFVPQEDIMLRELTIREILVHSALMRLPTEMTREKKKQKVDGIIKFLELEDVEDTAIGDEELRGISGGQRKRTNIGMELVAEPSVLFLDEPTSGLDSAIAFDICNLLKSIACHQGITVAAVIHSPSKKSFGTFDDLMLLCKGGRVVYFGPRDKAIEYFKDIGFVLPKDESEPDFMMEIALGRVQPNPPNPRKVTNLVQKYPFFCESWVKFRRDPSAKPPYYYYQTSTNNDPRSRGAFRAQIYQIINDSYRYAIDVGLEFLYFLKGLICWTDPVLQTPSVFSSFILLFKRACLQIYRKKSRFLFDQLLHLGCGAFVSLATNGLDYIGRAPNQICSIAPFIELPSCLKPNDTLQTVGVFTALGITFCGINAGTTTFGYEKVVYWRDTSSGMKTIPYFLAKVIADIPRMLIAGLMFSLAFILFYSYRSHFSEIFVIILLTYIASWELGYFLSAIFSKEKFGLVATGFALAFGMVLSGATPKLNTVESNNSLKWIYWMFDISAPRWAVEALYLKELDPRKWVEIHEEDLSYTYSFDDYPKVLNNILRIALAWSCLAFLAMKLISAPRWAVEALYLKELDPRKWVEIHEEDLSYTYSFDDYPKVLNNILRIALAWSCLAFLAMKLVNRDKQK